MPDAARTWLPVRAALHETGLYFAMRPIPAGELKDAFLYETTVRVRAPEQIVQVPPDDAGMAGPEAAPAGLIFHVARSGSTLLSQMLRQHGGAVVYAEPQAVNEILAPPAKWPRGNLVDALRSLGAAFSRHAGGPYVLKFSSWNTLFCDVLAEAFPNSAWIFTFRDPLEVGVSLLRDGPGWFRDDQDASRELSRLIDPDQKARSREDFVASVYGAFCRAIGRLDASRGTLIDYRTFPAAAWDVAAPRFGLAADDAARQRMADTARLYSKAKVGEPGVFTPDAQTKQTAASEDLRRAIERFARPELERLMASHARVRPG